MNRERAQQRGQGPARAGISVGRQQRGNGGLEMLMAVICTPKTSTCCRRFLLCPQLLGTCRQLAMENFSKDLVWLHAGRKPSFKALNSIHRLQGQKEP